MPDDISSLYPRPPQPGGGALSTDPATLVGVLSQFTNLARAQQDLASRQAIGGAYLGAINPDGSIDLGRAANSIRANPAAAYGAPEAATNLLTQRRQAIENANAQFGLAAGQNKFLADAVGAMADNQNLTKDDVRHNIALMSRNTGIPSDILVGWANGLPDDPAALRKSVQNLRNTVMGAAGTAARVAGPPGPSGEQTTTTMGAASQLPAMPVAQPPGEAESQLASAGRAASLQATADTTSQYHADLDNLKQLSKTLEIGGPTVEAEKKLNQLSSRFGLSVTMTPEQLKSAEEFDKIANQVSLNQSRLFHGSDAGLHTVVGANPNSSMSRYGREGVIDMLQGNQDAIDRARQLWLDARSKGAPAHSYDFFVNELSKTLDPRVFQFNRLSPQNQQNFLSQIDPDDLPDFERRYKEAMARGWVKAPKKQNRVTIPGPTPNAQ